MAARKTIPIWEKRNLTLEEAAEYFGIGVSKIRELSNQEGCEFVLWIGTKRLIKRTKLEQYLDDAKSI
ncbi:MAG: excisionase [Clostridia bacterium]|nr:excisionase [Clostridia bacterium]